MILLDQEFVKIAPHGKASTIIEGGFDFNFSVYTVHMSISLDKSCILFAHSDKICKVIIKQEFEKTKMKNNELPLEISMTHLLENPLTTNADIEFEVEGEIIQAHKCILMTQYSVINAILTNN